MTTAVVPITSGSLWRGPADVIAVGFYLIGVVPMFGLTQLEFGVTGGKRNARSQMALHAVSNAYFFTLQGLASLLYFNVRF
jgi:hypothetical protein